MTRHPVALELLRLAALPVAPPSASRFTQLSPTTAEHVRRAFGQETPFLLDGGPCEVGLESTVIAVTQEGLEVLRPGMAHVSNAVAAASEGEAHRSPGQHRKHYSPKTRIVLVSRGHLPREGKGAYLWLDYNAAATGKLRMPEKPDEYAAELYSALHKLDAQGFDWIAVELPPDVPEWAAIRDRLVRAAY
jgi:L-threonylcarbamoyladenylate synthase